MSPDWSQEPEAIPYAKLENPQSLNLYSYAKNNPLRQVDPDGHCCVGETEAAEAGAELGAEIGTFIEPGGGTAVGAFLGGAIGFGITAYAEYRIVHHMMSKGGKTGVQHSFREGMTDQELQDIIDDKTGKYSTEDKEKAVTILKGRRAHNQQARQDGKKSTEKLKIDPASVRARERLLNVPAPQPDPPAEKKKKKDTHGDGV